MMASRYMLIEWESDSIAAALSVWPVALLSMMALLLKRCFHQTSLSKENIGQEQDVSCTGVIPSNENTREGMIEIMEQLHAYAPVAQSSGDTEEKWLKMLSSKVLV